MEEYELLERFFGIFNAYSSSVTGWPGRRILKNGRRWRTSRENHDKWFNKNFVENGLLRPNPIGSPEPEGYFHKSHWTHAVRKDFAIKVLTLGYVSANVNNI